jgi:outer membrane protein assembly factor BamB
LAAWDAETGALLWKHGRRQASYASPMIATLAGVRQIVMVCEDAVSGHDADSGELLWEYDWPGESNSKASCTQPIDAGDDRLFFSKGYAVGSALVRIRRNDGGDWSVEEIWRDWNTMKTKFSNSLLYEGHVYGLDNSILACIELETGKLKWKAGRYGHAQLLRVGDKLIVLEEKRGKVFLVALDPERQLELAAFQALDAKTWNSPCLFGRYLLVRNSEQAACYELPRAVRSKEGRELSTLDRHQL